MALGARSGVARDTSGRAMAFANVSILDSLTQVPRTLFVDRDGETPLPNPFNTSANGFFTFYTAPGLVDIQLVAGGRTALLSGVAIIDDFPLPDSTDGAEESFSGPVLALGTYFPFLMLFNADNYTEVAGPSVVDGEINPVFDSHGINGLDFSGDGTLLAVALFTSTDPRLAVFDTTSWESLTVEQPPVYNGFDVVFSRDGAVAVFSGNTVGDGDPRLFVYDTSDWSILQTIIPDGVPYGLSFSPDGSVFAAGFYSGTSTSICLYDPTDWTTLPPPDVEPPGATGFSCWSPDGSLVALTIGASPGVVVYSVSGTALTLITGPTTGSDSFGSACAFSPDGAYLAVSFFDDPGLIVYDTSDWSEVELSTTLAIDCWEVAWSSDGTQLAVGHSAFDGRSFTVFDTTTWTPLPTAAPGAITSPVYGVDSPSDTVYALSFSG